MRWKALLLVFRWEQLEDGTRERNKLWRETRIIEAGSFSEAGQKAEEVRKQLEPQLCLDGELLVVEMLEIETQEIIRRWSRRD